MSSQGGASVCAIVVWRSLLLFGGSSAADAMVALGTDVLAVDMLTEA